MIRSSLTTWPTTLLASPGCPPCPSGGSRASGTHTASSDWDFALYYRDRFDPEDLRTLGWKGTVSEVGGWGGGVFNGGAWLEIDGRRVDVHYRDLTVIEHELAEAREGRFHIEPLMFHLAGIPSYLIVAELAVNHVLRGGFSAAIAGVSAVGVDRPGSHDAWLCAHRLRRRREGGGGRARSCHSRCDDGTRRARGTRGVDHQ